MVTFGGKLFCPIHWRWEEDHKAKFCWCGCLLGAEGLGESPKVCFICGKSPNSLTVIMSCSQVKNDMTHSGDGQLMVQLRIRKIRSVEGGRMVLGSLSIAQQKLWPGYWWCPEVQKDGSHNYFLCFCLTGTEKLHWCMHPPFQYALYLSMADVWIQILVKNLKFCYYDDFQLYVSFFFLFSKQGCKT